MRDTNPFEQLGLNKDVVAFLAETGQLEGFLKEIYSATITRVNPDIGGNDELAKLVNGAYAAIRDSPDKVSGWIKGMGREVTSEYKASGPKVRTPPRPEPKTESRTVGKYTIYEASTYALGMEALRKAGKEPFTFKENLLARLEQPELFGYCLDSDMGMARSGKNYEFIIIPGCKDLRNISADFNKRSIDIDFNSISGIKFDGKKITLNQRLPKYEILNHPVLLALVEYDTDLLKRYTNEVFARNSAHYEVSAWSLMQFGVGLLYDDYDLRAKLNSVCIDNILRGSDIFSKMLNRPSMFLSRR